MSTIHVYWLLYTPGLNEVNIGYHYSDHFCQVYQSQNLTDTKQPYDMAGTIRMFSHTMYKY